MLPEGFPFHQVFNILLSYKQYGFLVAKVGSLGNAEDVKLGEAFLRRRPSVCHGQWCVGEGERSGDKRR